MNTRIKQRWPLGWIIGLLLALAGMGLLLHEPDSGPHVFAILPTTSSTTTSTVPRSSTTTPGVPLTTTTTIEGDGSGDTTDTSLGDGSTTATTSAPSYNNVLVGQRFIVQSATNNGADYPINGQLTIAFIQSGKQQSAAWTAGCTNVTAPVVIHSDSIDVGSLGGSVPSCDGPKRDAEKFMTALMQANPRWSIESGNVVFAGGGRRVVTQAY